MVVRGLGRALQAAACLVLLGLVASSCSSTGGKLFARDGVTSGEETRSAKSRELWIARSFWTPRGGDQHSAAAKPNPGGMNFAKPQPQVPSKDPAKPVKTAGVPSIWPIVEPGREVMSPFGIRGRSRMHNGMDIRGPFGTPVYATADGVVIYSGIQRGYGKVVMIQHENGYETRYAHLDAWEVEEGETVYQGDIVGRLGQTGNATTPHVHYEVRAGGEPRDPADYFK